MAGGNRQVSWPNLAFAARASFQALQSAGQTLDVAEKRHTEAKKQLTQEQKELSTHLNR